MNPGKALFLIVLIMSLCIYATAQDEIPVSEFDINARQLEQVIKNQKEIIGQLEKTVAELKSQNKSLNENLNLLSNILITYVNYLQNLETQNTSLNKTLQNMNDIQDRTSKELKNLRLEVTRLKEAVKDLTVKVTPQRNES